MGNELPQKNNHFFIIVAIILLIIGVSFVIYDMIQLFIYGKGISANTLFGITLIYESLMVSQGKIPKSRQQQDNNQDTTKV